MLVPLFIVWEAPATQFVNGRTGFETRSVGFQQLCLHPKDSPAFSRIMSSLSLSSQAPSLRVLYALSHLVLARTVLRICTLLQRFLEWLFFMRVPGGAYPNAGSWTLHSPSDPALGEGVGNRNSDAPRIWYPRSCCHAHPWLSHCPWHSTLLLVASQQIKNIQQNPSPLPWLMWLSG